MGICDMVCVLHLLKAFHPFELDNKQKLSPMANCSTSESCPKSESINLRKQTQLKYN